MSTIINVFGTLLLALSLTDIFAHTTDDMKKLISDKTRDYNKKFRPVFDQSRAIRVSAFFELLAIQEFDEVSEKFSAVGFIVMGWWDEFLGWDPRDYGNMTGFAAVGGDFWQPNLVLVNPHDNIKVLSDDWSIFRYTVNGNVVTTPGAVFGATCSVDVTKYPWDEQKCFLQFLPWGYLSREVYLVAFQKRVGLAYYGGNGAWDIVDTDSTAYDAGGTSNIVFHMTLRRKPRFVLVNVILPIVFMSFLNMVVFLIPTDSGERISYCLTVLLALAVFLTLVGDNLPKTSNPMSILSYCIVDLVLRKTELLHLDTSISLENATESTDLMMTIRQNIAAEATLEFSQPMGYLSHILLTVGTGETEKVLKVTAMIPVNAYPEKNFVGDDLIHL